MTTVAKNPDTLVMNSVSEEKSNPPVKATRKRREYKTKETNPTSSEEQAVKIVPKIQKSKLDNSNVNTTEKTVSTAAKSTKTSNDKTNNTTNETPNTEVEKTTTNETPNTNEEVEKTATTEKEVVEKVRKPRAKKTVPVEENVTTTPEEVQKKITKKKSNAKKEAGAKHALEMRQKGKGIFAPKTLSPELAAICGQATMARTDTVRAVWTYIKEKKLNEGRIIRPDTLLSRVFPKKEFDMMEIPKMLFVHLS